MKNRFSKSEQIEDLFKETKPKTNKGKTKGTKPNEINWEGQFEKLSQWCHDNEGLEVRVEKSDQDIVDFDKELVVISSGHIPEVAFYFLLHELGHVVLVKDKKQYEHSYGTIWDSFSQNSLTLKVTTLQEELDAWREGLKIAKTLKLKVDRKKYEIVKTKAINTYLEWCSRK